MGGFIRPWCWERQGEAEIKFIKNIWTYNKSTTYDIYKFDHFFLAKKIKNNKPDMDEDIPYHV